MDKELQKINRNKRRNKRKKLKKARNRDHKELNVKKLLKYLEIARTTEQLNKEFGKNVKVVLKELEKKDIIKRKMMAKRATDTYINVWIKKS